MHPFLRDLDGSSSQTPTRCTIDIQWCSTNDMIADIMTKPLDKTTFLKHKAWLVYDPKMA